MANNESALVLQPADCAFNFTAQRGDECIGEIDQRGLSQSR